MTIIDFNLFYNLYTFSLRFDWLGAFMISWTRLSAVIFLVFGFALIIERFIAKQYTAIISFLLSLFCGFSVTMLIRTIYARPRPFTYDHITSLINHEATASFPSMHATMAFVIAVSIYLAHKKLGIAALLAASLTALSRVMVGVHFPIDVIAGAAIGIGIVILTRYLHNLIQSKRLITKNQMHMK